MSLDEQVALQLGVVVAYPIGCDITNCVTSAIMFLEKVLVVLITRGSMGGRRREERREKEKNQQQREKKEREERSPLVNVL